MSPARPSVSVRWRRIRGLSDVALGSYVLAEITIAASPKAFPIVMLFGITIQCSPAAFAAASPRSESSIAMHSFVLSCNRSSAVR